MLDVFFVLSKLFLFFTQSLHIVLLLLSGGVIAWAFGARALRNVLILASLALLILLGMVPIWDTVLRPLENRFPQPTLAGLRPQGLIVVGGAFESGAVAETRGTVTLNDHAERMTKTLALARRFPEMRIVFTGYSGNLASDGASEAQIARRFFEEQGLGPDRLTYENRSRNTFENALYSRELVKPASGETWLLVTSAAHMPRSVGIFRQLNWPVIPVPVDYKTPKEHTELAFDIAEGSAKANFAIREWTGLIIYALTGRSTSAFPGPRPSDVASPGA
jgi:uncharacterized SAM-binding protein YcdF (DUF218 family)